MKRFLITTLAEYQTAFWLKVGLQLRQQGHEAAFISFDDRSTEMLNEAGLQVFSATQIDVSHQDFDQVIQSYGIDQLNFWFGHERFAFGLHDSAELKRKLLVALEAGSRACAAFAPGGPFMMVQELGGFLSVIGCYFAARQHGINNYFIEPSFFRGRLFYIKNSFKALAITESSNDEIPRAVSAYLEDTVNKSSIVVPQKDKHQYTTAWKKIVNIRNAKRLVQKVVDKYLLGKQQEFGYIGGYVATHARMLWSSFRLRSSYSELSDCGQFVYYPLHVPGDMALTLRTPHLLDQLALVDFICRSVPHTHTVVFKEHPAMVGAIDSSRVLALLNKHDNLKLLRPSTNNYEVLKKTDLVVSINSKSGAEALLLNKQVIALGDAFYTQCPLIQHVANLKDLPQAIANNLAGRHILRTQEGIQRYFAKVWEHTVAGELYVVEDDSVNNFTQGMLEALEGKE